jgi:histone H3/H4
MAEAITATPSKKRRSSKKSELAWSPIRDLMKSVGAEVVARDAVNLLREHLVDEAKELTRKALTITKHSNRMKITPSDLKLVIKFEEE